MRSIANKSRAIQSEIKANKGYTLPPIESLLLREVNPALIFRGGVGGTPKTLLIFGMGYFLGQKGHLQRPEAHFGVQIKTLGKKDAGRARFSPAGA
jgi:hypothetical protein